MKKKKAQTYKKVMVQRKKTPKKVIELDSQDRQSELDEPPEYEEVPVEVKEESSYESIPEEQSWKGTFN